MIDPHLLDPLRGWAHRLVPFLLVATLAPEARASGRLLRQDLEVRLVPSERRFEVTARLDVRGDEDLTLELIRFASDLECDGARAAHEQDSLHLTGFEPGRPLRLTYSIVWPEKGEGRAFHLGPEEGYVLAESKWAPAEPAGFLGALVPYSVRITLPEGFTAVGAGAHESKTGTGKESISTIRFDRPGRAFFVYGRYRKFESDGIELFCLPSDATSGERTVRGLGVMVKPMIETYTSILGPAPDQPPRIVSVTRGGGWGAPMTLLLGSGDLANLGEGGDRGFELFWLVAHELAHTWWGGQVVPDDDGYGLLVEGMANYFAALAIEAQFGEAIARRVWTSWAEKAISDTPLAGLHPGHRLYGLVAYYKGSWIHRMLECWMGRETYHRTLREILEEDRRPTLASFRARLEKNSGLELSLFFEEWFDGADYPVYEVAERGKGSGWVLRNAGKTSSPPVPVEVNGKVRRVAVEPGSGLVFPASSGPIRIDPGFTVLRKPEPAGRPPAPQEKEFVDGRMESLAAALEKGDGDGVRGLFRTPSKVVDLMVGLAGKCRFESWSIEGVETEGNHLRITLDVVGSIDGKRVGGPLVLVVTVGEKPALLDATNIGLRYR